MLFKKLICFMIIVTSLCLSGCVQTRYKWNNYDAKLYNLYKEPNQLDQFSEDLLNIINESEATQKVPPGIYAEYGYVLYAQGFNTQAIQYFKKESDKWPESRTLMEKMTSYAKVRFDKVGDKAKPAPIEKENSFQSTERFR